MLSSLFYLSHTGREDIHLFHNPKQNRDHQHWCCSQPWCTLLGTVCMPPRRSRPGTRCLRRRRSHADPPRADVCQPHRCRRKYECQPHGSHRWRMTYLCGCQAYNCHSLTQRYSRVGRWCTTSDTVTLGSSLDQLWFHCCKGCRTLGRGRADTGQVDKVCKG